MRSGDLVWEKIAYRVDILGIMLIIKFNRSVIFIQGDVLEVTG